MRSLSVIIPTHNEARNIAECIESVAWADEVVVVDDFSDDGTTDIARAMGARVLPHEFVTPAAQKNWALEQASHPWVLEVDADERVTPALRYEIRTILTHDGPADGYLVPVRGQVLGRRMRFGAWWRERKLRLFRRDLAHFPERRVHEAAEVKGRVGLCRGAILHYSYCSLDDCFVKMRRYAEWGAQDWLDQGRRPSAVRMLLHGPARFARDYIVKLGFLDGVPGLIQGLFDAWQVTAKEAKLWDLARLAAVTHSPGSGAEHAEDKHSPTDA